MAKKIVYVDMDNVLVDFGSALPRLEKKARKEYKGRLDDVPGIFSLMDPVPGAVVSFTELALLFDVYILSTSPWENPSAWSDKLCWVKTYLGEPAYKRLILTHHKDLNRGDFLIDDRARNGTDRFAGKHIRFGSKKFPDWPAVMRHLRPRAIRSA
jgi:5'(3')-deoxyribonucleotidase